MPPELELLDQLGGGTMPYLLMERHMFEGNRTRALKSILVMLRDGILLVEIARHPVECWRTEHWRRLPDAPATGQELAQVELSLTDHGADYYYYGPDKR